MGGGDDCLSSREREEYLWSTCVVGNASPCHGKLGRLPSVESLGGKNTISPVSTLFGIRNDLINR